jgi:hypothetical protein
MDSKAGLDAVEERKISFPYRELSPSSLTVQRFAISKEVYRLPNVILGNAWSNLPIY